ncbi:MAG: hypothetical protein IPG50_18155 [Myxococcales bacterium]|nr:hypothetical protein [Myxococcales bacterium]
MSRLIITTVVVASTLAACAGAVDGGGGGGGGGGEDGPSAKPGVTPEAPPNVTGSSAAPSDAGVDVQQRAVDASVDGPRTRTWPATDSGYEQAITPPVCSPGVSVLDQSTSGAVSAATRGAKQTFVAGASGYLTAIEVSARRCHAAPGDRLGLNVWQGTNVVATGAVAFLPMDCTAVPDLGNQAGVLFDLRSDCMHVKAGETYALELWTPNPLSPQAEPRFLFGTHQTEGYAAGRASTYVSQDAGFADLAFRTYVAP